MTATIHSTDTRGTTTPFFRFVCPGCNRHASVSSADAVVGHRCPSRRNVWVIFKKDVGS